MKKEELDDLLNECLNDALCKKGGIVYRNSNEIAIFVTNWLNKKYGE